MQPVLRLLMVVCGIVILAVVSFDFMQELMPFSVDSQNILENTGQDFYENNIVNGTDTLLNGKIASNPTESPPK